MKAFSLLLIAVFILLLAACKKEVHSYSSDKFYSTGANNSALNLAANSECAVIDASNFGSNITNPYFPLVPGTVFHYVNRIIEGADTSYKQIGISVSSNTKIIAGVEGREVHDVVTIDGELSEYTYDGYGQDKGGIVWYFA